MVAVEWPIAVTYGGSGHLAARVAGGDRLPVVRADFFLDPRARLSEQERAIMTAMLADLVASLADDFAALLGNAEPANDDGEQLLDRLWKAGLLDIPNLVGLLLGRAEEERISAALRLGRPANRLRFLQSFVGDGDSDVSAAAMALILARGRRRDRFEGARIVFDDVSAETAVALVNATSAAIRPEVTKRMTAGDADERLTSAARALLSRHDEGNRLEARLFEFVHAIERAGRLDDEFVRTALEAAEAAILVEALARLSRIGFESAWQYFVGGGGKLAMLLRMSGVSRELAGEIAAAIADIVGSSVEDEVNGFDALTDESVESAREWLRLDPAYRSAIHALALDYGNPSV